MVGVVWAKMFVYELDESRSYFCLDRLAKRWIVVYALTLSIFVGAFLCFVKFEFVVVVGFINCGLENNFC